MIINGWEKKQKKNIWKSLYYQNTYCAETRIFQQQCQYIATDTRCRRASGTQEQEYPTPLPLGTADPATVRRASDPRIIGDHPGAGVPTR